MTIPLRNVALSIGVSCSPSRAKLREKSRNDHRQVQSLAEHSMLFAFAQAGGLAAPSVPLSELVDTQLLAWGKSVAAAPDGPRGVAQPGSQNAFAAVGKHTTAVSGPPAAAAAAQEPAVPEPAPPRRPAKASLDTGHLDLSAFGMLPAPADEPSPSSRSQLESGQLDMSALGMPSMVDQEPPQSPPWSERDTGQLDLSAFGMALPPPELPVAQPLSQLESGQLDMSAFGLPSTVDAAPPPAAEHSQLDSGQLDLSAFGMAFPNQEPPREHASSRVESGYLYMSAVGLPSAFESAPAQPVHNQLQSGQLDLSAFGMSFSAPEPPQQPPAAQIDSGQLDLSAFGLPSLADEQRVQQPSSALVSGQLDLSAFGMGLPAPEAPGHTSKASLPGSTQQSTSFAGFGQLGLQPNSDLHTAPAAQAAMPERPFTAEELRQLRSVLGLTATADASPSLPGKRIVRTLAVPDAQHTAAAFLAIADGADAEDEEGHDAANADAHSAGAGPTPAPGLTIEETAEALDIAQLLLPDGTSTKCDHVQCRLMYANAVVLHGAGVRWDAIVQLLLSVPP